MRCEVCVLSFTNKTMLPRRRTPLCQQRLSLSTLGIVLYSLIVAVAFQVESDVSGLQDFVPISLNDGGVFLAYTGSDGSSFYRNQTGTGFRYLNERTRLRKPKAKLVTSFFNFCPDTMELNWEVDEKKQTHKDSIRIQDIPAFVSVSIEHDPDEVLYSFKKNGKAMKKFKKIKSHEEFDPLSKYRHILDIDIENEEHRLEYRMEVKDLTPDKLDAYWDLKDNLELSRRYRRLTGREYLPPNPRSRPLHSVRSAVYYGERHQVLTKETHFETLPPQRMLGSLSRGRDQYSLAKYRSGKQTMVMELRAIAPRVFEISNFLSKVEVDHLLDEATKTSVRKRARTLHRAAMDRDSSPITDIIYKRAADLLGMDDALLNKFNESEPSNTHDEANKRSTVVTETLQVEHHIPVLQRPYKKHDSNHPKVLDEAQISVFATLVVFLGDDVVGGETLFPNYIDAETNEELKVTPETGKAVLIYSMLPDGNHDLSSRYAISPVKGGEMWTATLGISDLPSYRPRYFDLFKT